MKLNEAKITNFYGVSFGADSGSEKAIVKIPHYQRPYRWTVDNIETLINDWNEEKSGEYFAGSIVTVMQEKENIHQLIDGQQRFTTVFLVNFVCFLLVRTTLREAILLNRRSRINGLLDSYKLCCQFLFHDFSEKAFEDLKEDLLNKVDELDNEDNQKASEQLRDDLLKLCYDANLFPDSTEGSAEYLFDYKKALEGVFKNNKLKLTYDRSAFSLQLKTALTNSLVKMSTQTFQKFTFISSNIDPVVTQYQNSIEAIFKKFSNLSSGKDPLSKALNTIKNIKLFLSEVKFCVIQTGNIQDAYTLFEVLNDRALALDDLDLIKNQFYRRFCLSNEGNLTYEEIDSFIENREKQWGDSIFPDGLKIANKPLITYMYSSYYSGETDYLYQASEKNRKKITKYLEDLNTYSVEEFEKDFNTFQAATMFLNKFDVWHKSKTKKVLLAEYSDNHTATYRLVHLLSALNQYGVLVGLTNTIFKYIDEYVSDSFEPSKVAIFYNELISDNKKHLDLHELSKSIWQLVMQSKSAELPRDFAVKLIISNNFKTNDVNYNREDFVTAKLESEFTKWFDNWQYNKTDTKVCVLFARLLRCSIDKKGKLKLNNFKTSISQDDVSSLHLDHMEPRSGAEHEKSSYFIDPDREFIINGIGNMMPLPGRINISKSNKPLKESFSYLEEAGLGDHWFVKKSKDLFFDNNNKGVPKKKFFQERKALIRESFYSIIKEC